MAQQSQLFDKLDIENQIKENEKNIDYYITEYTIELLVQKLRKEELFIPEYQRKNIWEDTRKSKFIESVLIGLPIPLLFFWQNPETGKIEIIDGAQRMTTLNEFESNHLQLKDLERLDLMNGKKYSDLLDNRQLIFKNKSIRAVVLSNKTDEQARLDLFERINTGSKIAEPSEIRRGLLQGEFYSMIENLAHDRTFNELAPIGISKQKEGEREELITRFFAYGDGLEGYKQNVSGFLYQYTKKMNEKFSQTPSLRKDYEQRFHQIMQFFKEKYPIGFRKDGKGRVPRTRFEGMSVSVYLAEKEQPNILNQVTAQECNEIFNSDDFNKVVRSDGANSTNVLKVRLNFAKDKILGKHHAIN